MLHSKHINGLIAINAVYTGTAAGVLASGVLGLHDFYHSIIGIFLFSIPGLLATLIYLKHFSNTDKDDG